ncbi:MAG: hypothetical protein H6R14_2763 [Proteobacteria bacterium]|nr:hypothetical protein [Pseudomonadota bacterium]
MPDAGKVFGDSDGNTSTPREIPNRYEYAERGHKKGGQLAAFESASLNQA